MVDAKALGLYRKNDIVGLFRHLGPMWLKVCMETLEDLQSVGFHPNPERYKSELAAAGIFVERMEVAMAAVLSKAAKQTNWAQFESANQFRLTKLPQQRCEEWARRKVLRGGCVVEHPYPLCGCTEERLRYHGGAKRTST